MLPLKNKNLIIFALFFTYNAYSTDILDVGNTWIYKFRDGKTIFGEFFGISGYRTIKVIRPNELMIVDSICKITADTVTSTYSIISDTVTEIDTILYTDLLNHFFNTPFTKNDFSGLITTKIRYNDTTLQIAYKGPIYRNHVVYGDWTGLIKSSSYFSTSHMGIRGEEEIREFELIKFNDIFVNLPEIWKTSVVNNKHSTKKSRLNMNTKFIITSTKSFFDKYSEMPIYFVNGKKILSRKPNNYFGIIHDEKLVFKR